MAFKCARKFPVRQSSLHCANNEQSTPALNFTQVALANEGCALLGNGIACSRGDDTKRARPVQWHQINPKYNIFELLVLCIRVEVGFPLLSHFVCSFHFQAIPFLRGSWEVGTCSWPYSTLAFGAALCYVPYHAEGGNYFCQCLRHEDWQQTNAGETFRGSNFRLWGPQTTTIQ